MLGLEIIGNENCTIMSGKVEIGQSYALANLIEFAESVITEQGNIYYHFPCWFQLNPNFEFTIHRELPEDLTEYIVKAGLGNPNPQIKKPEI
jgi:hypothetical protein